MASHCDPFLHFPSAHDNNNADAFLDSSMVNEVLRLESHATSSTACKQTAAMTLSMGHWISDPSPWPDSSFSHLLLLPVSVTISALLRAPTSHLLDFCTLELTILTILSSHHVANPIDREMTTFFDTVNTFTGGGRSQFRMRSESNFCQRRALVIISFSATVLEPNLV
ncbi:hypothetical protein SLEP1_g29030 [Rubroshorea leprosula]|uniref:Uncharacterized protein n=1 Tax=Rubroshorea leprosula TaxID=152421 RepID=A0AAV5K7E7_9ROSI|nr:hypothetical protein SLEP1_g29030 [Rubroshorea leprosula]